VIKTYDRILGEPTHEDEELLKKHRGRESVSEEKHHKDTSANQTLHRPKLSSANGTEASNKTEPTPSNRRRCSTRSELGET
jgi:hypothetical protein